MLLSILGPASLLLTRLLAPRVTSVAQAEGDSKHLGLLGGCLGICLGLARCLRGFPAVVEGA